MNVGNDDNNGAEEAARIQIQIEPPGEETVPARIGNCVTRPQNVTVLPHHEGHGMDQNHEFTVDVMNTAPESTQAYIRIQSKQAISLDHHAPGWGVVYFGVIVTKVPEGKFQCPPPNEVRRVAIKRLSRAVVNDCLRLGRHENPYKEIQRAQTLGDNIHVLGVIEALQDEEYLYIIMPYCERKSLAEWIPWGRGIPEHTAASIYQNILENLLYCREHGICHRDLSPDNCMVLNGRVVFNDLAMSFRIPPSGYVTPMGGFGKPHYLPPEVCYDLPFSPTACDLWSSAVILFNLVTGEFAFEMPCAENVLFCYLVLARGVSTTPINEQLIERLETQAQIQPQSGRSADSTGQERIAKLRRIAQKCTGLSPAIKDLIGGILKMDPLERLTTHQALETPWMQQQQQDGGV